MKIHLPKIFTAKPKKKLRATAVRRPLRIAATADYDDLAEPNMKLSRALLIVLLLHIVAVSGIIAFNAIKTHQSIALPVTRPPAVSTDAPAKTDGVVHSATASKELAHSDSAKGTKSPAKSATKDDRKTDHAKATSSVADAGKTYVVAKGENPLTIAHKFKVSYDDLLAINHIDDPHKLQIGQKLIIPAKPKPKKTD
jgi:LysM repeat protein